MIEVENVYEIEGCTSPDDQTRLTPPGWAAYDVISRSRFMSTSMLLETVGFRSWELKQTLEELTTMGLIRPYRCSREDYTSIISVLGGSEAATAPPPDSGETVDEAVESPSEPEVPAEPVAQADDAPLQAQPHATADPAANQGAPWNAAQATPQPSPTRPEPAAIPPQVAEVPPAPVTRAQDVQPPPAQDAISAADREAATSSVRKGTTPIDQGETSSSDEGPKVQPRLVSLRPPREGESEEGDANDPRSDFKAVPFNSSEIIPLTPTDSLKATPPSVFANDSVLSFDESQHAGKPSDGYAEPQNETPPAGDQ